ncbi:MAG: hypothetical protein ABEJ98_02170 [Candidatus Nanohaloarchaea archaeon]
MKAQSSLEFMSFISLSMLMLAVLYGVIAERQVATVNRRVEQDARATADKIAFNLEMAQVQGEGYSRVISLYPSIGGGNYTVIAEEDGVKVDWGEASALRSTRYTGRRIKIHVDENNVFRVVNNASGIYTVPK